jgi:protein-serine/threonine kinase
MTESLKCYIGPNLGPHRGAIDQTTTTTQPPPEVMKNVRQVLETMGVEIQVESEFKYRCIRAKRRSAIEDVSMSLHSQVFFFVSPLKLSL